IYVFRNRAEMAAFTPMGVESIEGFSTAGIGRNVFVMNAEVEGSDRSSVVCHEFTHVFVRSNFADMPLWLNEGLAEYYQSFRLPGHKAEFGHDFEGASYWLGEHEWADIDLLFAMKGASEAYRKDNELRTTTYAEGWAITHYLRSDPGRAAQFDSILSA